MTTPRRNKRPLTVYLEPSQLKALHALSKRTDVPQAVYIRQGVAWVVSKEAENDRARWWCKACLGTKLDPNDTTKTCPACRGTGKREGERR